MEANETLKKLWFAYFCGLLVWMLLTYGYIVNSYRDNTVLAFSKDGATAHADFILYYNDGILAWEALKNKINIYDPQLQNQYLQKLVPHVKLDKIFYSQYPPYLFVIMMPLPFLPIKTVWILWEIAGMAGVFFITYSLLKGTLRGKFTRAFTYLAVVASFPAWLCFRLGQVALLLYPALMWYWIALDRRMWFRAGLLGGFCLLKLQYAPILFMTGFFLGGFRFAAGYAVMAAIYFMFTVGVLGWDNLLRYPQALKFGEISGQVTGVAPEAQQNIRGQLVVLFNNDGSVIHLVVVVAWAVATLATAYLWWRYSRSIGSSPARAVGSGDPPEPDSHTVGEKRRKFMLLATITMILQLVTSPHTHRQDYIFMTLPAVWLMYSVVGDYPLGEPALKGVRNGKLILALRYLLIGFPLLSWVFYMSSQFLPVLIQPFFAWAIALLVILALIEKDLHQSSDSSSGTSPSTSSSSSNTTA